MLKLRLFVCILGAKSTLHGHVIFNKRSLNLDFLKAVMVQAVSRQALTVEARAIHVGVLLDT